jgi:hypothetical protein
MIPGLALASMLAAAPSAPPVSSGRVLVLDTVAPGIAAADRERLDERIVAVLAASDIPLASDATREAARACTSTVCRERTAADRGITHWVRAQVIGEERDYRVTIAAGTIADSIEGPALASSIGECNVCGIAELTASIESHTVELRERLVADDAERRKEAMLAQSRPSRANHAAFRTTQDRGPVDPMRPAGLALLAAGSASAIGGAVLLGIDGNDVRRRCSDTRNVDADGDCRYVHDTLVPGIAMVSGGILAVAGGITLVSIERRRRGRTDVRARLGYNRIVISGRF